ncbi:hypothetical protein KC357_g9165 [Hortaea werneckii]|nr:hypothetical protein KC357_g9165 [Hortaea werneckii]
MVAFHLGHALLLASALGRGAQAVVRGVNLGGWLVTEPWMTPSLFEDTDTEDEWHLCNQLGKDKCLETLQDHWENFYTRDDLVAIKRAGLNSIRIPLGYWAVDLEDYEPYVKGQYPYLIRAVKWAQELGLTVFLDIHGAPGSQNGYSGSGLVDVVTFQSNQTNADRTLKVLRNLTQEFSQEQYGGVVTNIEPLNEPLLSFEDLKDFYEPSSKIVNVTGINFTIHDGFYNPHSWANYDPNNPNAQKPAPHLVVDTHQFWAFPPLDNLTKLQTIEHICDFGQQIRNNSAIPYTLVGEWSLSTGITANTTGNTEKDAEKRTWFRELFEAQNAAFTPYDAGQSSIGWYFWAWKLEYDIDAWSYRRGLSDGYIPSNISDPSTYEYPIKKNGCIDSDHEYEAKAQVTFTTYSPSSTATSSSSSSSSGGGSGNDGGSDDSDGSSSSSSSSSSDSDSSSSTSSGAATPTARISFESLPGFGFLALAPLVFFGASLFL